MNHHQALRYQPGNPAAGNPPAKANFRACQHLLTNVRSSSPGNRPPDTAADPAAAAPPAPFRWRSAAASAPGPVLRSTAHRRGARKGTDCSIGGIHRKTGNLKNRRIRLRHGGTGYQETGSAPYDAAGPTHAQAVMQHTEKRKTGIGIKVVITDRHNRQTIPGGRRQTIMWENTASPAANKITSSQACARSA